MVTGFQTIAGAKYYFASSGLMQTGWFKINGTDYYATSSGAIKAQWVGSVSYTHLFIIATAFTVLIILLTFTYYTIWLRCV